MSVNKVILIGFLGADPEIRQVGDTSVANFNLATSESWKDRETGETKSLTTWVRIAAWRGLATLSKNYLKKGSQIYLEGKLRDTSYTDKDGNKRNAFEVQAEEIRLLDRKESTNSNNHSSASAQHTANETEVSYPTDKNKMDDDLPF